MRVAVMQGSCLDWLAELADCSVDSVVTDPPAGIGFMGKTWDKPTVLGVSGGMSMPNVAANSRNPTCQECGGCKRAGPATRGCSCDTPRFNDLDLRTRDRDAFIAFLQEVMEECFRVLKPGGHALVWGIPRTAHWTATAVENAGFEIRDTIAHIFGQGFPKNLDVAKAIQKSSGVKPIGEKPASLGMANNPQWNALNRQLVMPEPEGQAAEWEGWGTALKPAREDWILARKPLAGTVARNVLEWGTGAINIDGCRIGTDGGTRKGSKPTGAGHGIYGAGLHGNCEIVRLDKGRYPANVIFDEEAAALLDAQSGDRKSGDRKSGDRKSGAYQAMGYYGNGRKPLPPVKGDEGGASRFFYVAKPSRREKEAGCDDLPRKTAAELTGRREDSAGLVMKHDDGSEKANPYAGTSGAQPRANHHPTVKPVALMRYLCRMVTPPGGLVLDPFCGSGTTGVGAVLEGFRFFGIDQDADYVRIAQARIEHALKGDV